ncbi:separase isoform X1, partial [Tanacetum coccineum]
MNVGFRQSLCVNPTLSSPDSYSYDNGIQSSITLDVKKAVSSLANNDSSSKMDTNSFLAAHLYFDLAERMIAKGLLSEIHKFLIYFIRSVIEALSYAKKSFDWRWVHFRSCFTIELEKGMFCVNSEVATSTSLSSISSKLEHIRTPWRALQCILESFFQVGCIYNLLGDRHEAQSHLTYGQSISTMLDLSIFSVSFSLELGKLNRKHHIWEKAQKELENAQRKLRDCSSHIFCKKCKAVLEVSGKQQLGDLYFDIFNCKNTANPDLENVISFYRDAENMFKHPHWVNNVSCPMQGSETTTRFCTIIGKGSSNDLGYQNICWHCQPAIVATSSSLKMYLDMKWECIRRRLLVRVLTGI